MRSFIALLVIAVFAVTSGPAGAQTLAAPSKFEIMPIVGYRSGVKSPRGNTDHVLLRTELGGVLLGMQMRGRLHRHLSAFVTGVYSGWGDRTTDALGDPPAGGAFRWLVGGLSLDVNLKGVVPLSFAVAPGIVEERYDERVFWSGQIAPAGRDMHRMLAIGAEAMFPLRERFIARAGVRDHVIWWDAENLDRAHMWTGHMGIGVRW